MLSDIHLWYLQELTCSAIIYLHVSFYSEFLEPGLRPTLQDTRLAHAGSSEHACLAHVWFPILQVIHAPHISRLSSQLGTTFWPIQYRVEGSKIISNVQYSRSLFKEGWLSASGSVEASGTNTLQILFDKFWIDFGISNLREELPGTGCGSNSAFTNDNVNEDLKCTYPAGNPMLDSQEPLVEA